MAVFPPVTTVTSGILETTQIDRQKKEKKPRQPEINFDTITNLNKFKVYTNTVLQNILVNFSAVSDFQFINIQCPLS